MISSARELGSVLAGYQRSGTLYDELLSSSGEARPHWSPVVEGLDGLGFAEFTQRWSEAQQMIREHGITYNVYGDPRGQDRPWQLDPIPFLISPTEAEHLEKGLVQRGRLLEAVLADVYGPQRLLHDGLLPPELVFANPCFLRACHGIVHPGGRHLHLMGVDLGRGPDGVFRVLGDRTQAPSGAGYALENRIVLGRMLPEIFHAARVQRLALFFRTLRDTLRNLAPHNRDHPRAVLLTPGPYNETYFEHAYLARYLGFTLAEGADLTVRDHRVYLKLLDGLQPVDVILRRLDDDYCDPLELKPDSFLGVPGLVQAVRSGNVIVANPLGSGFAEGAALMPYYDELCRTLLGEELLIPSVPTFWCGEPRSLEYVLGNISRMVIKASFPALRMEPVFLEKLSRAEQAEWIEKIRARPWAYVAQELLDLSTTPVLTEEGIVPRQVVMRAYLAARDDSFVMMPGGLTRVTSSANTHVVSLQHGGGSKDTWVLTDGDVSTFSMLPRSGEATRINRGGNDLPSRAADNLYWLGRYVQRAEDLVRLLRGIFVRLTEKAGLVEVPELPCLLRSLAHLIQSFPGVVEEGADVRLPAPEAELRSIIFDEERIGSLAYNFQRIYRAAFSVRDRISLDMWRIITMLAAEPPFPADEPPTLSDILDLLNQRVITLSSFGGIAMESMTRGHGWRFLEMGRKIERAQHIVSLIHGTVVQTGPWEAPLLEALLEIADSSMTYRRRYLSGVQIAPVLDLILADESNPRSLVYQLQALRDVIDALPRDPEKTARTPEQRRILSLLSSVQLADIESLVIPDENGIRKGIEDFLVGLDRELPLLSDSISHRYLSHLQISRQLARGSGA